VSGQQRPSATEAISGAQSLCAEHKGSTVATVTLASASAAAGEGGAAGLFPIAFAETIAKSDVTDGIAPDHSVTTHGAPRASLWTVKGAGGRESQLRPVSSGGSGQQTAGQQRNS
jgi:hypothetical protein